MSNERVKISKTQERNTVAALIFLYMTGKFEKILLTPTSPAHLHPLCAPLFQSAFTSSPLRIDQVATGEQTPYAVCKKP